MVHAPQCSASYILTPDADLRRTLFGDEVLKHPAKQNLAQLYHLLDRFAIPDGFLLDPFAGSGSIMIGASYGMHVVSIEMSPPFHNMEQHAWEHYQCSIDMQECYDIPRGTYLPLLGDSRDIASVFSHLNHWDTAVQADLIVTSPSYGGSEAVDRRKRNNSTIQRNGGGNAKRVGYQQIDRLATPMAPHWGGNHAFGPHSQLSATMAEYTTPVSACEKTRKKCPHPTNEQGYKEVTEKGRKSSRRSEEPGEEVSKDTQKKQNGAMKTQNTGKNQEIIPEVGSSK